MPLFFDKVSFNKLKLNFYTFNTPRINISNKNKREFLTNQLMLLNYESIYTSDTFYQYSRISEYMPYFWKLQRLIWFSRYCNLSIKNMKNKVLLVANTDAFASIAMFLAKKYEQQYVFHWLPGLRTNNKMISKYFIKSYSLTYMFHLVRAAEFTIFLENNVYNLSLAFKELTSGSLNYPFVLFSVDDIFFSTTSSFLTRKSETLIYYYLSLFFSLFYHSITREKDNF